MPVCQLTENCIFFNEHMPVKSSLLDNYRKYYCGNNFHSCSRYIVKESLGIDYVPIDLFPHQQERVDEVISLARKHPPL